MQFLKILLWVVIAVLLTVLAGHNWHDVTLNLWGDIQADIKLPALLLIVFLIGFLPTWLTMRARQWALTRRLEALERNQAAAVTPEPSPIVPEEVAAAASSSASNSSAPMANLA